MDPESIIHAQDLVVTELLNNLPAGFEKTCNTTLFEVGSSAMNVETDTIITVLDFRLRAFKGPTSQDIQLDHSIDFECVLLHHNEYNV